MCGSFEERGTVLVLDDCEDLRELTTYLIERMCDRRAIAVRSLTEMMSLGEKVLQCEIAILDINLGPNQPNGVEVYRWLRNNGFKSPVFFLTGHARTYPLVVEAEKLGDAKVLSKPILPNDLIQIIRGPQHEAG